MRLICRIDLFGNKIWENERGLPHREDGPAIIYSDGKNFWYQHGKLHRDDGPAIEDAKGNKWWYQYSLVHRENGPAIVSFDGVETWWIKNKILKVNSQEEFERYMKLKAFW